MSTSEEPLAESMVEKIQAAAIEGAGIVGTSVDADPGEICDAINRHLAKPKKRSWFKKVDNWDPALAIGSLWGVTMVRSFGWHWADLTQHDHNDFKVVAVVNEDRSFAIFPFHFCYGCLENDAPPKVLLAFNMLEECTIPPQEAGAYLNLMDCVHHIIPPG